MRKLSVAIGAGLAVAAIGGAFAIGSGVLTGAPSAGVVASPASQAIHVPSPTTAREARRSRANLERYVSEAASRLAAAGQSGNAAKILAGITLRRPLAGDAFLLLASRSSLDVTYVEWVVPGSFERGGSPIKDLGATLQSHPGAQIVFALALGSPASFTAAASEADVLVVDPSTDPRSTPPDLYDAAAAFGLAEAVGPR